MKKTIQIEANPLNTLSYGATESDYLAHSGRKGMKRGMSIFQDDYTPIGQVAKGEEEHNLKTPHPTAPKTNVNKRVITYNKEQMEQESINSWLKLREKRPDMYEKTIPDFMRKKVDKYEKDFQKRVDNRNKYISKLDKKYPVPNRHVNTLTVNEVEESRKKDRENHIKYLEEELEWYKNNRESVAKEYPDTLKDHDRETAMLEKELEEAKKQQYDIYNLSDRERYKESYDLYMTKQSKKDMKDAFKASYLDYKEEQKRKKRR